MRLSDAERNDAMSALARAVGEGRLSVEEFEERCDNVMQAHTRGELKPLFSDIPSHATTTELERKIYSRADVERARQATRRPKLGTALLITLGASALGPFLIAAGISTENVLAGVGAGLAVLFLIPVVWIALYIMKVGPDSWHTPSPRQIEREHRRQIQMATAQERAQQQALRRQQMDEITNGVMDFATRRVKNLNRK